MTNPCLKLESEVKMKVMKRIVIVADIRCDEDFDCNELLIAQDITPNDIRMTLVGCGKNDEWEIVDYLFQQDVILNEKS